MDRAAIAQVAKLLAKAASTGEEAEAMTFVEGSYRLLARELNACDAAAAPAGGPRRERRLLTDRRAPLVVPPVVGPGRASCGPSLYHEVLGITTPAESSEVNLLL